MHKNQQDHDRLNHISTEVTAQLQQETADWDLVYRLAMEASEICDQHGITCPFDLGYIRSIKEQAA